MKEEKAMNKSKLSISLVSSLVAAMAMTACSKTVTSDKKAIVKFKGYDGEEVAVVTDDLYYEYLKDSSGISKFYDAMLEVLIRYEFQNSESALNKEAIKPTYTYAQIERRADDRITYLKSQAKDDAKTNNTKYDTEWQKVLDSNGVENVKELKQKLIYDYEKDEVKDWYFRANEAQLLKEYLGIDENGSTVIGNAHSSFPYHIRHILTSISSGSSDFYNGTITKDEALKLYTVVKALRDGKDTFGEIAHEQSGDSSSAELYGSVGIMDVKTSFVNEFKLGLYAYDAVYNHTGDEDSDKTIRNGLGLSSTFIQADNTAKSVKEKLQEIGLTYVPVDVFDKLNEYKDMDQDELGHQVNENNANYYPRNILWNKYLNHHNIFVITNNTRAEGSLNADGKTIAQTADEVEGRAAATAIDTTIQPAAEGKCGFRYVQGISQNDNQLVLTDEQARPIIGVRSEHGIHFMIIEKSIYDFNAEVNLTSYYSTKTPEDTGYSSKSYVGYINTTDASKYKERANTIKDAIKSFDSTYDYRLYDYFLKAEGDKISFLSVDDKFDLQEAVAKYVNSQREYNYWNADKTLAESWRTYIELIEIQNANRVEERLIPEMCALKYTKASSDNKALFSEGGSCYYVK